MSTGKIPSISRVGLLECKESGHCGSACLILALLNRIYELTIKLTGDNGVQRNYHPVQCLVSHYVFYITHKCTGVGRRKD